MILMTPESIWCCSHPKAFDGAYVRFVNGERVQIVLRPQSLTSEDVAPFSLYPRLDVSMEFDAGYVLQVFTVPRESHTKSAKLYL
jgi:hypothetical protein